MDIEFRNSKEKLIFLPRPLKRFMAVALDSTLCILSVWLAYFLRLGELVYLADEALFVSGLSVLIAIPVFWLLGLYNEIFRFSGWPVFSNVLQAIGLYALFFICLITIIGIQNVPRTIGIIQPIFLLLFVSVSRYTVKKWLGGATNKSIEKQVCERVLIYGAGEAGQALANFIRQKRTQTFVGYIDDDAILQGQHLNGKLVFAPSEVNQVVKKKNIDSVLLALPSIGRLRRNEIINQLKNVGVSVRTLPSLNDFAIGNISFSDVRDLEIEDLLGREPVVPNTSLLQKNIKNKCVMITGAGGSIGGELCRQILKCEPSLMLLVEQSEYSLYSIHQELQNRAEKLGIQLVPVLASVSNESSMQRVMSIWKPNTVYHAAAYKHVPLVEHNIIEGVRNNVFGTLVSAKAAIENKVSNFVLVSTDKAVRPTNIMGASKRLSEMVLQALAAENPSVNLSMVRFGNVLGSSGSVVPKFRQQIREGGPVTITHPDITRFFMTIPEASQLVIQAGAMANGGDVFVLDMGVPVKIVDLAKRIIELSGLSLKDELNPKGDIEIEIIGLRHGEKLFEELLIGNNPETTAHSRIMKAHEAFISWAELEDDIRSLDIALNSNNVDTILQILYKLVPDFTTNREIVDWSYSHKDKNSGGTKLHL